MTIVEAIHRIDVLKPNSYTQTEKMKWLSALDGMVKEQIIDTHEAAETVFYSGYTEDTSITTELLVPHPYDEMYLRWLEMQMDYANGEYGKYNNSKAMFEAEYTAFSNYYNRTHMPLGNKLKYF